MTKLKAAGRRTHQPRPFLEQGAAGNQAKNGTSRLTAPVASVDRVEH